MMKRRRKGGRKEEKVEGERGKGGNEIEVDPLQRLQDNVNIECNGRNVLSQVME